ncbi:hypothetical protein Acor_42640 [Acrocarpospora corrugata]|uniref:Uncharacterized protein n=1 Tax=Acrocarpospora corrugata TaxID=35763 RepID=A0A5M3W1M4_9ACTN|nr:hypothetical protein Acor_42640 [Acrocarpospora corrugata]
MSGSKQTTFTLVCAAVLSAALPGMAGYASARMEAYDQTKRELARLRAQLDETTDQTVPAPRTPANPHDPAVAGYLRSVPEAGGRGSCGSALWPGR